MLQDIMIILVTSSRLPWHIPDDHTGTFQMIIDNTGRLEMTIATGAGVKHIPSISQICFGRLWLYISQPCTGKQAASVLFRLYQAGLASPCLFAAFFGCFSPVTALTPDICRCQDLDSCCFDLN
jgi:hypothetical protein